MINIGRRAFIALLGGAAAAWPLPARAQQGERMPRIGMLIEYAKNDPQANARLAAFGEGLGKLGWTEGRNVHVDYRWTAGDLDRIRASCAELVALNPSVILCSGGLTTTMLWQMTHTVPIVFVQVADPVGIGLVPTLMRPGGNITGFTNFEYPIIGKWLEALKQISPATSRVLMIQNPQNLTWEGWVRAARTAAASVGVALTPGEVRDPSEIERTIAAHAQEPNGGMIVLPDTTTSINREQIIALAARHHMPAVYPFRFFVNDGGLISYGSDPFDLWRRSASYVDRIIRGENVAELPVQAPTKFELAVNLKTANSLGLSVPPTLLAIADEVIE